MAIIGKIREKSYLLVGIVFIALLAFIFGNYEKMFGRSEDVLGMGTVYEEKINPRIFDLEASNFIQQDYQQAQEQRREYGEKDKEASEDKAWSKLTEQLAFQPEFDALGIDVNNAEFDSYLYGNEGFTAMPELLQNFADPMGRLDVAKLQNTISQLQKSSKPEDQKRWEDTKNYYTERRKQEKYFEIIKQGVFVTKLEAEEENKSQKTTTSISYVFSKSMQ